MSSRLRTGCNGFDFRAAYDRQAADVLRLALLPCAFESMKSSPFQFRALRASLGASSLAGCFCVLALNAPAQQSTPVADQDHDLLVEKPAIIYDWTQHVHLGALVGLNISANFNEKGLFNISGDNAANGIYNDGYVREDQTGNAGGYTGYWGYDNASQYNSGAQTLAMHNATSYDTSGSSKENGSAFPGFEVGYGDNLWDWKRVHIGWDSGFGFVPIDIKDDESMSATVNQTTYTYGTGGIVVPSAPYHGGPSGSGEPIISATPSSTTSQAVAGTVTGSRSLDVFLMTFRLGPSFSMDLSKRFAVTLGAGPALGVVAGEYKYDETITTGGVSAHNSGKFNATAVTYGGYVNATVMYHLWDDGPADIYAGAQYMPMTEAKFSNGGRQANLNLGGQVYFTVGINWPF